MHDTLDCLRRASLFFTLWRFLEHHVLDSTGFLELIGHLEESYGIKVLDDEMVPENLDSLESIAAYVDRKRSA